MPLTEQQLHIRRGGVTGSQIAVLAGLCPWGSAIELYREKVAAPGEIEPKPLTEDMSRGIWFEEPCIRWYIHRTGRPVARTETIVHPDLPLVIATPDGVSMDPGQPTERQSEGGRVQWRPGDTIVEVKCPSWRTAKAWGAEGSDQIPRYYYPQVIWEMAVTGLKHAHVVAYFGDQLRIYNVPWDQGIFERLYEVAETFWTQHVLPRVPPPPDATTAYAEYLAELFPASVDDMVKMEPGDGALFDVIASVRQCEETIRVHSKRLEEAKNILKSRIGINRGLEGNFGRITWAQNRESERVDWQAVAREAGASDEQIGRHTTTKPGPRVFRAHWRDT